MHPKTITLKRKCDPKQLATVYQTKKKQIFERLPLRSMLEQPAMFLHRCHHEIDQSSLAHFIPPLCV